MKKIINAKLEEAKQFNKIILENIKEAIPISKTFLANTKKAINSLKQSKKSFLNVQNSSNETKTSIDEFIKANNDYTTNPTAEKLKLINEKRSTLLYEINLNSNNAKIFSRDVLISKNDMFKNIETMKEILPTLKYSKVYINKLNLTYLKMNQLMKKPIKNLNSYKPKQLTRPIFRQDPQTTPPPPNCDEVREFIKKYDDEINEIIEKLNKISPEGFRLLEIYEAKRTENFLIEVKVIFIEQEIKEAQEKDFNIEMRNNLNKQIKEIKDLLPSYDGGDPSSVSPQKQIATAMENWNFYQRQIRYTINKTEILSEKDEKSIFTMKLESAKQEKTIEENLKLIEKYGTTDNDSENLKSLIKNLEKMKPKYEDYIVKFVDEKLDEISKLNLEIKNNKIYIKSIEEKAVKFRKANYNIWRDLDPARNNKRQVEELLKICKETPPI